MATMRGAVVREAGGADVLKIETLPVPEPGLGEILIRAHPGRARGCYAAISVQGTISGPMKIASAISGARHSPVRAGSQAAYCRSGS